MFMDISVTNLSNNAVIVFINNIVAVDCSVSVKRSRAARGVPC